MQIIILKMCLEYSIRSLISWAGHDYQLQRLMSELSSVTKNGSTNTVSLPGVYHERQFTRGAALLLSESKPLCIYECISTENPTCTVSGQGNRTRTYLNFFFKGIFLIFKLHSNSLEEQNSCYNQVNSF